MNEIDRRPFHEDPIQGRRDRTANARLGGPGSESPDQAVGSIGSVFQRWIHWTSRNANFRFSPGS
jgi:hypothetical protein